MKLNAETKLATMFFWLIIIVGLADALKSHLMLGNVGSFVVSMLVALLAMLLIFIIEAFGE